MQKLYRTIHPEVRVLDAKIGVVEYVASDETLDSYREIIRASGWRFTRFAKNAPFVNSHDYSTIENLLGKVVDFTVRGKQLVETVQWAIDVPDHKLAQLGWKLTEGGFLKAVSVGFLPTKYLTKWDGMYASERAEWLQQLKELGLDETSAPRTIFIEQEQIELSACIIGANANALAKAALSGVLKTADVELLETLSQDEVKRRSADAAFGPADVAPARQREQETKFLERFERALKGV